MSATPATFTALQQRSQTIWLPLAQLTVVAVALIAHSYNIFGYPLYLGDEGIYMARAYAVTELGWLTPYTYWYDHAPAGWLLIAAWSLLSGGFDTFGTAVNGGRVLMLLLHLATVAMLFRVTLRLAAGNLFAAAGASLVYALSPLTLTYGRMVLLDNIMIFWAVLAALQLLQHNGRLWPIVASGFSFGIAVLSKENAFLLLPAFIYGLWTLVEQNHARFARAGWLFAALATISLYPLYAAIRTELLSFDLASPFAGQGGAISLAGSVLWQLGRSGGAPWDPGSDFYQMLFSNWWQKDMGLLGLGVIAAAWNLIRGDHARRLVALLAFLAIISIGHGNPVYEFYIASVLAFLALNIGVAIGDLAGLLRSPALAPVALVAIAALSWNNLERQQNIFTLDLTAIQRQALAWVREHVPDSAQIVTDDDLWVDLRASSEVFPNFPGAHSHWQVADDPAVYRDLFHDDWRLIDYMVLTPNLDRIFARDESKMTYLAYSNSTPVATFSEGNATVEIRKINHPGIAVQDKVKLSYESFISRYVRNGQVRPDHGYTDARAQATAMLMAVWMDDQETFDQLWQWTFMHLQSETGLLYPSNEPGVDLRTITAADTDAALALLLAEQRWQDASYGRYALAKIQAIWEQAVVEIKGRPYLAAGNWAVDRNQVIFEPAAFAPYAYHLFATADPDHNWWYLLDTQYQLLAEIIETAPEGQRAATGLPPAYAGLDRRTGQIIFYPDAVPIRSRDFNDQAAQVYWRVGLDAAWHDDERADDFLKASPFLRRQWQRRGELAAAYSLRGQPQTQAESLLLYSAVLPKFLVEDPQAAHEVYGSKLAPTFNRKYSQGQWGDGTDVAQEQWAWLAGGLYTNMLLYQWPDEQATP